MEQDLQNLAINTLRFLSVDGVQKANSGHPGLPMGCAAIAYTIWTRHLHHNPVNPKWHDRDRFILSGGHGCMLLYSLLHLTGYDLPLDELKNFRQWGSRTPGHPEYGLTPGVELTTGPLGQGFAGGVGFAIAEAHLAAVYNRPGHEIINHYTYAIVTDGDLMEGVASEAASLAGHLKLGKLIYLYDDNHISIDGSTDISFTEDRSARFTAYNWQVLQVADGNDVYEIDGAIKAARQDPRPSLIVCHTHIGFGLPTRQDTAKAHGEAPGVEELTGAKQNLGWPLEPSFYIPDQVLEFYRKALPAGADYEADWLKRFDSYRKNHPDLALELDRRLKGELPADWQKDLPSFPADPKGIATRAASGKTLNALAVKLPEIMGGSADLTPSNNTWIETSHNFQPDHYDGRYLRFGVREHGMGAIVNGLAVHGGFIPYGATFTVFSDYMRGALRLSAISHYPSIWIYTHDSIGLGEDGPTHQPVEHLAALRAIPNLTVIRPMDANETVYAWQSAIAQRKAPTALLLTRQVVPVFDRVEFAPAEGLLKGAYVLKDLGQGKPRLILMASGSEVQLIIAAGLELEKQGVATRLVSFPSWELFSEQTADYRAQVLPQDMPLRIAVEAGISQGWERWVGDQGRILSIEKFGASAPYKVLFEHYGFTPAKVIEMAKELLGGK
ncbi:MAG: transketolase [Anaerolineaceae bacterium]